MGRVAVVLGSGRLMLVAVGKMGRVRASRMTTRCNRRQCQAFCKKEEAVVRLTDRPEDRIVVIYGAGHAYLLKQFAVESPAFGMSLTS